MPRRSTTSTSAAPTATASTARIGLGIDIGGTGIKGALVDLTTGELASERTRIDTPEDSTPENVADVVAEIVESTGFDGEVGIAFPSVIRNGVACTAANIDKSWIDTDVRQVMSTRLGLPVEVINDADAAGLAEVRYGAGRDQDGVVCLLTFGTGIGSALFNNGVLLPNTEFGHIECEGMHGEEYAAASVRTRLELSYAKWAPRVDTYLKVLERGLWMDLIVVGGGASKKAEKWVPLLTNRTPVRPAELLNSAGIVGAAFAAAEDHGS